MAWGKRSLATALVVFACSRSEAPSECVDLEMARQHPETCEPELLANKRAELLWYGGTSKVPEMMAKRESGELTPEEFSAWYATNVLDAGDDIEKELFFRYEAEYLAAGGSKKDGYAPKYNRHLNAYWSRKAELEAGPEGAEQERPGLFGMMFAGCSPPAKAK